MQDKAAQTLTFVKEISKYFMDFLETDFHKRKHPRRSVKLHNPDNLQIGVKLAKYPEFCKAVYSVIQDSIPIGTEVKVPKGLYKAPAPQGLIALVKLQIAELTEPSIDAVLQGLKIEISDAAEDYPDQYDKAIARIQMKSSSYVSKNIIDPLMLNISKPLSSLDLGDENSIYLIEEELTDILLKLVEDKLAELLRLTLAKKPVDSVKALQEVFNLQGVRDILSVYFDEFRTVDLFEELFELDKNHKILDNQELYLYFFDVAFEKEKYPLFYVPLSVKRDKDIFEISFDSQLYINKRAIEFIVEQFNALTQNAGSLKTVSERILYLGDCKGTLPNILQGVIDELAYFFKIDNRVALANPKAQTARSMHVRLSNSCYFALFDKSDEALINDYEEILSLKPDNPLVQAFQLMIGDFIEKNPESFYVRIEDEWDDTGTVDRLIYKSPIPLNSEQLKILSAIRQDGCKYITVEGPPGTGKSHTITAVVFDHLLNGKSVLVLSDKKEALDVVEDKITNTLNRVRFGEDFQNPILRLGKTGNTYSQILSKGSIDNIMKHYRAVKEDAQGIDDAINRLADNLRNKLSDEANIGQEISISDIESLEKLAKVVEQRSIPINADEFISNSKNPNDLTDIRKCLMACKSQFHDAPALLNLNAPITEAHLIAVGDFQKYIDELSNIESRQNDLNKFQFLIQNLTPIFRSEPSTTWDRLKKINECWQHIVAISKNVAADPMQLGRANCDVSRIEHCQTELTRIQNLLDLFDRAVVVYPTLQRDLALIPGISDASIKTLEQFIAKYSQLNSPLFGFLFKGAKLDRLNEEFKQAFPYSKCVAPQKQLKELTRLIRVKKYLDQLIDEQQNGNPRVDAIRMIAERGLGTSLAGVMLRDIRRFQQELADGWKFMSSKAWFAVVNSDRCKDWQQVLDVARFIELSDRVDELGSQLHSICEPIEMYVGRRILKFEEIDLLSLKSSTLNLQKTLESLKYCKDEAQYLSRVLPNYPKTLKLNHIDNYTLPTLIGSPLANLGEGDLKVAVEYIHSAQRLGEMFARWPSIDYSAQMKDLHSYVTLEMSQLLDGRVIQFCEEYKATAASLRQIIRNKQKFPRTEFARMKSAFPCILAGIRDYAEYIPLEGELFDLVVIDEASQVSIAQAFPALMRAKKVLILGDKKQFSNVKTAQARTDMNHEYLSRLKHSFTELISTEPEKLARLTKFNIKTSILEFFEYIANYNARLVKHFRGYKELISYSNNFFYQNTLQVMKIRGKPVDQVLKFTHISPKIGARTRPNTNPEEAEIIIQELEKLKASGVKVSVGIITPHTAQQKLLLQSITNRPGSEYFFDNLRLKIMTFDTCQGEERDIIFYSMVATPEDDRLGYIFIKNLSDEDVEEEGKIKVQRLNVGFSRAKECIHIVTSKTFDHFDGSIGQALRHYQQVLADAQLEKSVTDVDQKSPMEAKVLNWFYQTSFWRDHKSNIELWPQFEIGHYLQQLDPTYQHPLYKVDFLLVYVDDESIEHKVVIEYDGFKEHFEAAAEVDKFNYEEYYSAEDLYREKVLESYGYRFLRINRFNAGSDPIAVLNQRLRDMTANEKATSWATLTKINRKIDGLQNGYMRECPKCHKVKETKDFRDHTLKSGYGRACMECKDNEKHSKSTERKPVELAKNVHCPKCHSAMVVRNGTRGKFYGCSTFPRCRGTRPC